MSTSTDYEGSKRMNFKMDNLILILQQNLTFWSCNDEPFKTTYSVLNDILLFFGFPTTVTIIVILLSKAYKARTLSIAEVFLLQINFANVCLCISELLMFLNSVNIGNFYSNLYTIFYSPNYIARPIFLLGTCVIFHLAIVHPVTYLATKTWVHWVWLIITLVWIGSLVLNVALIFNENDFYKPIYLGVFFLTFPPSILFNVITLRALSSRGPGNSEQTLNPAKKKAFRIILGILVVLLLYYFPRGYLFIYPFVASNDFTRFMCVEGPVVMMLPKISEIAMPIIFLYSLRKLGV